MIRKINVALISSLILILSCSDALAQRGLNRKASGGWGRGSANGRMYDTNTVETLNGTVTTVERITQTRRMYCGIHLMLKTNDEEMGVHLGPAWFIDSLDISIEQNDTLKVTGSRITYDGKPALIAANVDRGDQILILRDEIGIPVWSGWRRRR